jgi:xanthine dehydrogenase molybdopterin-binding subunit B
LSTVTVPVFNPDLAAFAARQFAVADPKLTPPPDHIRFEDGHIFDDRNPSHQLEFGPFCHAARHERVDLGARGFFATPGIDFDRETGRGSPFLLLYDRRRSGGGDHRSVYRRDAHRPRLIQAGI